MGRAYSPRFSRDVRPSYWCDRSRADAEGQAKQVAYVAAKAGIAGMTLAMAPDLAAIGVRACAIAPEPILTPPPRA
jgi:NAD(P)-dependent dehydrogenase (short-subunit alcohol dehydrogenase family)